MGKIIEFYDKINWGVIFFFIFFVGYIFNIPIGIVLFLYLVIAIFSAFLEIKRNSEKEHKKQALLSIIGAVILTILIVLVYINII